MDPTKKRIAQLFVAMVLAFASLSSAALLATGTRGTYAADAGTVQPQPASEVSMPAPYLLATMSLGLFGLLIRRR